MNQAQVQQDISIIKEMIEKTRRETAESGFLFIIPGILCVLTVIIMSILERLNLRYGAIIKACLDLFQCMFFLILLLL